MSHRQVLDISQLLSSFHHLVQEKIEYKISPNVLKTNVYFNKLKLSQFYLSSLFYIILKSVITVFFTYLNCVRTFQCLEMVRPLMMPELFAPVA